MHPDRFPDRRFAGAYEGVECRVDGHPADAAAPGTRIFAAEDETHHIVGCATLCVYESPTGRKASIEDVVVTSAYRGQGLGRALLQGIIDFAGSKLSPIDLHLTSSPWREEANALYLALGFEQRDTNVYKMSL